jgi:hypothetical protein
MKIFPELIVRMDSRMLDVLRTQAENEGFVDTESWARSVLFVEAVSAKLNGIVPHEDYEEIEAFTREIREWLTMSEAEEG